MSALSNEAAVSVALNTTKMIGQPTSESVYNS
jgi:hypothetical protein